MSGGEKLLVVGAVGVGLLAVVKYRASGPTAPMGAPPAANPSRVAFDNTVNNVYATSDAIAASVLVSQGVPPPVAKTVANTRKLGQAASFIEAPATIVLGSTVSLVKNLKFW
jgi:hypothetical protein